MGIILDRNHAKQQTSAWTFRFLALKWKPPAYSCFHCRAFGCRVAFANFSEAPFFSYFWSYFFLFFFYFWSYCFPNLFLFVSYFWGPFWSPKIAKTKKQGNRKKKRENLEKKLGKKLEKKKTFRKKIGSKIGGTSCPSTRSEGSWGPASPFPPGCLQGSKNSLQLLWCRSPGLCCVLFIFSSFCSYFCSYLFPIFFLFVFLVLSYCFPMFFLLLLFWWFPRSAGYWTTWGYTKTSSTNFHAPSALVPGPKKWSASAPAGWSHPMIASGVNLFHFSRRNIPKKWQFI